MESFEVRVTIAAGPQKVINAFWDLEEWPKVAPHVRSIEMHYCDAQVQVLTFHVETKGRLDRFQSVRIRQGDTIYFFQPSPPPILNRHYGSWKIEATQDGTLVTSRHTVAVNVEAAVQFLRQSNGDVEPTKVSESIQQIIRHNSLQTMRALKARVEAGKEETYAPQTASL